MTSREQLENLERLRKEFRKKQRQLNKVPCKESGTEYRRADRALIKATRNTNFDTIAAAHADELAELRAENERQFASLTGHCLTAMQPTIGDPLRWHEGESDGNRVLAGVRKMAEEVEKLRTLANQFRGSETGEGYLSRLMLDILEPTKGSRNG